MDQGGNPTLFDVDEFAWALHQAEALRAGRHADIEHLHLADFLTDMARRDLRELKSRLKVLAHHLLKLQVQGERATRSWLVAILTQQSEITDILDDSATMARMADELLASGYPAAVKAASVETGVPAAEFPVAAPWTVAEMLRLDIPAAPSA